MSIILGIIALSLLIIVHEFGHFIVAKLTGIKVLEFSLFMGPKLFGIQKGETLYSIRAIPLGGYVKMEGEEESSDDERAFNKKPILVRAAVIIAGPIMNLIAALITIIIIVTATGYTTNEVGKVSQGSPAYEAGIESGDKIIKYGGKRILHPGDVSLFIFGSKGEPVEVEVLRDDKVEKINLTPEKYPGERYILGFNPKADYGEGSNVVAGAAEESALKPGDIIIAINDIEITNGKDIRDFMKINNDEPIKVKVLRDNDEVLIDLNPTLDKGEEQYGIGLGFASGSGGIIPVIKNSTIYAVSISRNVYYSLAWLISGRVSISQMSGPIGIISTIGDVVELSPTFFDKVLNLLSLLAFIGINLGLFNLIPFPALDGSKLLLLAIEGIRKRALPPEKEAIISFAGFVLLIILMIFTTYNDIVRNIAGG